MADYCKACSIDVFGDDYLELAGLTTEDAWGLGMASTAVCEGCGLIQVDPAGNCVSPDCRKANQPGHGLPWKV